MSEAKFTNGKWVADIRVGCCAVYTLESRDDWEQGLHNDERSIFYQSYPNVVMKPELSGESVEKIANAHLIAAAPDTYHAAISAMRLLEGLGLESSDEYQALAHATAKARGDTL